MKNCKKLMEKRKYWIGEYNLMEIKFDWEILLKLLEEAYGDIIPPSTAIKTIFLTFEQTEEGIQIIFSCIFSS